MTDTPVAPSPRPDINKLTFAEVFASLKAGLWDFKRAPLFGVFFSAFYVVVGFVLLCIGAGTFVWTLALSLGFPLVAPFAAVGLYEVSRRLEADEPLIWSDILALVWRAKGGQLPWIGVVLLLVFLFWSFFAHMSFALFLGPSALTNISTSYDLYLTPTGFAMIAFQIVVGALVAFLTFGLTVVALPLLVEKEFDFVTAMLISLRTVSQNKAVMVFWAAIVAACLAVAMAPFFLGLFIALPVLGHATWHLYRRALYHPL